MIRFAPFLIVCLCGQAWSQVVNWNRIDTNIRRLDPALTVIHLPEVERNHLLAALLSSEDLKDCAGDQGGTPAFRFFRAPVGRPGIVYVVPGAGCFRGGQGSNASLWLADSADGALRVLAKPSLGFAGWGLGVQPHISHGLHDLVVGWHMSAFETGLTYLRFDGRVYRKASQIYVKSCAGDGSRMCLPSGRPARNSEFGGPAHRTSNQRSGAVATPTKESAQP